ncbi:MAG: glycerate kinase [Bacillota bacterium]|nr:glycerate kinase [Bacillota bacterium]
MTEREAGHIKQLRVDARQIMEEAIHAVLPEAAVIKALSTWQEQETKDRRKQGRLIVIAIGKAAWRMASVVSKSMDRKIDSGLVVTKYGHTQGSLDGFQIIEAGHPLPDEKSVLGAAKALQMVKDLTEYDQVMMLISGGGSALFEKPMDGVSLREVQEVTDRLLSGGAAIGEINTIRKRLSAVKGGRFAEACGKARILTIVLSDVLGDRLDVIASGPMEPDQSTADEALAIAEKFHLKLADSLKKALTVQTPKKINNSHTVLAGNVDALCAAAAESSQKRGYQPVLLTTTLDCEAREAGRMMAAIGREVCQASPSPHAIVPPCAIIAGGETIVRVTGQGKGGRNQELALAAALGIQDHQRLVVLSAGSDGTDGPTDAAGGMVDGESIRRMKAAGLSPEARLADNDAYHALKAGGDLIITGPTGTNVNDLTLILCR